MPPSRANILIVFYSRDGSVEALAKAVSEGAREAGAEVRLRRVPDLVSSEVMAKVLGWQERSKRMLADLDCDVGCFKSGGTQTNGGAPHIHAA